LNLQALREEQPPISGIISYGLQDPSRINLWVSKTLSAILNQMQVVHLLWVLNASSHFDTSMLFFGGMLHAITQHMQLSMDINESK